MIARREPRARTAALGTLKRLARDRRAPLILVPDLPDLATTRPERVLETAQVSLQAILGELKRR